MSWECRGEQGAGSGERSVSAPNPLTDEQLAANFADIAPALTNDAALLEANKCLYCHDAPCTIACPTHIDVPAFIKKIATDYVLERKVKLFEAGQRTGKRVAIVGAGPAGLACARDLRRCGHEVTVFEAKTQPGGLNTYGIAEYKLKADVALAEAHDILDLGVELRLGIAIGRDIPFEKLLTDYDAVFVGVGLGSTKQLGIPGEDLPGVVDALTFIEHLKTHPYRDTTVGRQVVVIGAGNTAIDAVTQAK